MDNANRCAPKALAAQEQADPHTREIPEAATAHDMCLPRHKPIRLEQLQIPSPKRNRKFLSGWEGFFPYYAGYPEAFAHEVLRSAQLPPGAVVLDPWNGSGTTTLVASRLGLTAHGLDLNPVMVVVARARLLPPSEASHLKPLAATIVPVNKLSPPLVENDPLLDWFEPEMAAMVRAIERNIGFTLLGENAVAPDTVRLDQISGTTATLYVALFAACRRMVRQFMSSNPTWLRRPHVGEAKVTGDASRISSLFQENVTAMANALTAIRLPNEVPSNRINPQVLSADSASFSLPRQSVDFILTSPPYCTRIDYTAATRIELAVLDPLVSLKSHELKRKMIGSTQVPIHKPEPRSDWGPTCLGFLERLRSHRSKASATYYYVTHLDYFDKLVSSIANLASTLRPAGAAVFVVQDSHYKEIHNDLPTIVTELTAAKGLVLARRDNFQFKRSMAGIHPHSRAYGRPAGGVEAVLCFHRE
ncbi:MAG: DNA methyltransferase [Acetobacteraceae bacterium]